MDLVALRIAGRRLSSAGLCFRLPCGRLAFVKKDELRSSSRSARLDCWFECHVTCIEGSIEHALVWHCFMKLSLRTEPSELKDTAAASLTIACDIIRWLARLQPSHPLGMHAMDDDAYVGDVAGLGT